MSELLKRFLKIGQKESLIDENIQPTISEEQYFVKPGLGGGTDLIDESSGIKYYRTPTGGWFVMNFFDEAATVGKEMSERLDGIVETANLTPNDPTKQLQ